jgi:hypothetical protein
MLSFVPSAPQQMLPRPRQSSVGLSSIASSLSSAKARVDTESQPPGKRTKQQVGRNCGEAEAQFVTRGKTLGLFLISWAISPCADQVRWDENVEGLIPCRREPACGAIITAAYTHVHKHTLARLQSCSPTYHARAFTHIQDHTLANSCTRRPSLSPPVFQPLKSCIYPNKQNL